MESDAHVAQKSNKQQEHFVSSDKQESIVNVLAILSDGKTSVRGPSGTGFFVEGKSDAECRVATSLHAIIPDSRNPLSSVEVTAADGKKYKANFETKDRKHDLAILTLEGVAKPEETCKPLELSQTPAKPGDPVTRLTRDRWGDNQSYSGKFASHADRQEIELVPLEGEDPNRKMMIFDLYNNRGVDLGGSPIFNQSGEVIALHNGGLDGKTSVATPVDDLRAIVEPKKN